VRYVYDTGAPAEPATSIELTPDRLSALPADLVTPLRDALQAGDVAAALRTIELVREREASLADDLSARVRAYKFEEILDSIELLDATRPTGERH
jgi:hypothetical protein